MFCSNARTDNQADELNAMGFSSLLMLLFTLLL
jgi:hypothetical protein